MKRVTSITLSFIAILTLFCATNGNAQQCPPPQTGEARLTPDWTQLDCIYRNNSYSDSIGIENLSSVAGFQVDSLRLDSISVIHPSDTLSPKADFSGPPSGINYVTQNGTPVNTWAAGETGCIELSGTTNAPAGNYQLGIWVSIWANGNASPLATGEANNLAEQFNADADFSYFLKVRDQGESCDSIYTGINETTNESGDLSATVRPNPFTNSSRINVYTESPAAYKLTIHNMLGEEVRNRSIDLRYGENQFQVQRGELTSGVYLMNLASKEGSETISQKLIIGSNR